MAATVARDAGDSSSHNSPGASGQGGRDDAGLSPSFGPSMEPMVVGSGSKRFDSMIGVSSGSGSGGSGSDGRLPLHAVVQLRRLAAPILLDEMLDLDVTDSRRLSGNGAALTAAAEALDQATATQHAPSHLPPGIESLLSGGSGGGGNSSSGSLHKGYASSGSSGSLTTNKSGSFQFREVDRRSSTLTTSTTSSNPGPAAPYIQPSTFRRYACLPLHFSLFASNWHSCLATLRKKLTLLFKKPKN